MRWRRGFVEGSLVTIEQDVLGLIGFVTLYLDALAIVAVTRDDGLTSSQRIAWCALVVLVPIVGAILALLNGAELNPEVLPARLLWLPVLPLLRPSHVPGSDLAQHKVGIAGSHSNASSDSCGPGDSGPVI
jgi:hypothetical protein